MEKEYDIIVSFYDTTYIKIDCPYNMGIFNEITERFSFYTPGYKFHPKVKAKMWDGIIRLFNRKNHTLPFGLLAQLVLFANDSGYSIKVAEEILPTSNINEDIVESFCDDILNLTNPPRDYQIEAVVAALKTGRRLILSPTGSGKSYIFHIAIRYLLEVEGFDKILLVVPTVNLVSQMLGDFIEYGQNDPKFDRNDYLTIPNKRNIKNGDYKVIISTWQSLQRMPSEYFNGSDEFVGFDALLVDEVHTFAATVAGSIAEKSNKIPVKIGMTGTLANTKTAEMQLIGLFGQPYQTTTTKDLMEAGILSTMKITAIQMNHPELAPKMKYADEMEYLRNHAPRNQFIASFAEKTAGNSLILFQNHDQGDTIVKLLREKSNKRIFHVTGRADSDDNEMVRQYCEANHDAIVVANYQVFSTGINIKNLHNVIFASPTKSAIRILQSIGRALRKHDSKDIANIIDLYDEFGDDKTKNHTFRHFLERYQIYMQSKFDVNILQGPTF